MFERCRILTTILARQRATYFRRRYFLPEAHLWNMLAGPTFRYESLLKTQCSDVADDACFSSRVVSWTASVAHDTPLLVQPIHSDDAFAAKFHRYSGVIQNSNGVERQCCIPNCSSIFPAERPHVFHCSYLKEHATNKNDVEKGGTSLSRPLEQHHSCRQVQSQY